MKAKYSPQYRLPLFQRVLHDSVVATERWEMSLSKMPSVAKVRALFWQLYNVAPIWNINLKEWRRYKDRAVEHHHFFSEVHKSAAFLPITNFVWHDENKAVQSVVFGESLTLKANFSAKKFEGLKPLCIEAEWKTGGKKLTYCPKNFPE